MLLALLGAIMILDRLIAFAFDEFIFILLAEIIIIYSSLYTLRDGLILAFCSSVIILLFGSLYSYIYLPLGILAGLTYSYGIKKDLDRNRLVLILMPIFIIGEIIMTMVVLPMFGFNVYDEIMMMSSSLKEMLNQAGLLGLLEDIFNNIIIIVYIISILVLGILESILVHLFSIYLLKRFKIKDIKIVHLYSIKISKLYTYVSMAMTFLLFAINYVKANTLLLYTCITLGILGSFSLAVVGYIFFIVYGSIVLGKNISLYVFLFGFILMPYSLIILLIAGFLYGSGPLRSYIERKRQGK